jgi:hypothetical protein
MIAYSLFGAFTILVPVVIFVPEIGIVLATIVGLGVIVLRVRRMGSVVSGDGLLRRGFLGNRQFRWSDISDIHLHDNNVAIKAVGMQVTSRYVVVIRDHHRSRRWTIFFFDERAFPNSNAFQAEYNAVVQLWHHHRSPGATP